jgi:hypothetical protein
VTRKGAIAGAAVSILALAAAIILIVRDHPAPGVGGSGVLKTEVFEVDRFDHVTFEGVGTARITIGDPQSLQVTTDDNLFALLAIDVKGNALTIRSMREIRPSDLLITIRVPDLRGVALAGNPNVEVPFIGRDRFDITVTGNGTAEVSGQTGELSVTVTGSGLVRATGLVARRAGIEIHGAGDVEVYVTEALAVTCAVSGNVRYAGEPTLTVRGPASIARMK